MGRQFSIAIVGAGYPNKSGPGRRFEIALCSPGEILELRPEPNNRFDRRAIAVYSSRGIQIGYVRAEQAQLIGTELRRGGVTAVFQRTDAWGATARVATGGLRPVLPEPGRQESVEDPDWWPDPEYDD